MILVKVTAEKDNFPCEFSLESIDENTAPHDATILISVLIEKGFKAPSKPSYSKGSGKSKTSRIDYDSNSKLLTIATPYIGDKEARDKFNEEFKAAFKEATKRFVWFNAESKLWQYPPPNNEQAKPLSAGDMLAIENHDFFKTFERGDGFKKAVESIKEHLASKEQEKQKEENPF